MNTRIVGLGVMALAACVGARGASAQSVNVGGGQLVANHYLLGSSMRGVGGSVTLHTPVRNLDFNIGLDRYSGTSNRFGVVCAGLIQPGTCGDESIQDEAKMYLLSAGPSYNVVRTRDFTLSVLGQVQGGGVNAETYGLRSGRSLAASKAMWGVTGGIVAGWKPYATKPFAVQGTASVGRLSATRQSNLVDGYAPFDGRGFRTQRASLGVAYLVGRGR